MATVGFYIRLPSRTGKDRKVFTVFTAPRINLQGSSVFNHLVHHRAQLGVYLRPNNVAVPAIYGPSADEGTM